MPRASESSTPFQGGVSVRVCVWDRARVLTFKYFWQLLLNFQVCLNQASRSARGDRGCSGLSCICTWPSIPQECICILKSPLWTSLSPDHFLKILAVHLFAQTGIGLRQLPVLNNCSWIFSKTAPGTKLFKRPNSESDQIMKTLCECSFSKELQQVK